ncbi:hypothetical protein VN12_26125 [Pirellula sp. SH-Sr6A]|uniref:DUF1559 family PulG-like putative transporter n=1 Tax=Pirellula sp. SH-Sr6A TaxID=1632865 RepID=UPI00078ED298|nr:DUF1559 domain-containing protein [Pirellula sp. SH-Sr6A]AMV35597.1 hypothetical protein VN12_26125 [Pirellula sp. SH-Sr6A]
MLEILVCIALLCLLSGLVLMGVSAARESSRRLQCQNTMRQNMLSLVDVIHRNSGKIPRWSCVEINPAWPGQEKMSAGPLAMMAIEQGIPLWSRGQRVWVDPKTGDPESYPPPNLRCPSNESHRQSTRLSFGVDTSFDFKKPKDVTNIIFRRNHHPELLLSGVSDGLSYTAAISERIPIEEDLSRSSSLALTDAADSFSEMSTYCEGSFNAGYVFRSIWPNWWDVTVYESAYNHSRSPNSKDVDCISVRSGRDFLIEGAIISARSGHRGGVNVGMLDASIHFVSDGIDISTWRSLATHDSGDIVGDF